ncbi:MAG: NUDIX hydrolase [Candidatus Nomurabacteria bacterium GW2011_GWB1_37_5]|uniref:NUDIX hydrolase n=1 Tax=Candidatus Nomurabacteria bacterium GW2011_GWB1_37_5 TaxID=1618742 RepID=A0A0G0H672_9BACT|nr:MAG: NUDIX hydrolase [Candidatus Nomurabacteria bacterium GW2011_GWB1_37_5]
MSKFLNPTITVDIVIFTIEEGNLKILLINRDNEPFKGAWALPGGFLHEGETSKKAAQRILKEKAGVSAVYIEQLYTFDKPSRDPRGPVFSVSYFALVPPEEIKIKETGTTQHPKLYSIEELPKLGFDHNEIIQYAIKRIQAKLEYTNAAYSLLPKFFTFSQLQKTYEAIFDKKFDKRNFQKKFLQIGLIKKVAKKSTGGKQRPAQLYSFVSTDPNELKKFF